MAGEAASWDPGSGARRKPLSAGPAAPGPLNPVVGGGAGRLGSGAVGASLRPGRRSGLFAGPVGQDTDMTVGQLCNWLPHIGLRLAEPHSDPGPTTPADSWRAASNDTDSEAAPPGPRRGRARRRPGTPLQLLHAVQHHHGSVGTASRVTGRYIWRPAAGGWISGTAAGAPAYHPMKPPSPTGP